MGNPIVGQPVKFHQAWDFVVEVSGVKVGGFTAAEGLEKDHKVIIQKEGGNPGIADVSNGPTDTKPITLKRGGSDNHELYDWSANVEAGIVDIRDVSIVGQRGGVPVVRYNCEACALSNFKAGSYDRSKEEENLVEEITFQPKRWKRVDL